MSIIDFIRDIGIHYRMSSLLSRDSVQNRLNSTEGMTFTEFSYQLFQGYDFAHLYKNYNCRYQLGGSDQWGNIASGIELIRKMHQNKIGDAFGITVNLLVDSNGAKLGKSSGNGLSLDADEFSFYQFFINTPDDLLETLFKSLTFMPLEKISATIHHGTADERYAHKELAKVLTTMVYGKSAVQAIEVTNAYFSPELKHINEWTDERIEQHFKNGKL